MLEILKKDTSSTTDFFSPNDFGPAVHIANNSVALFF